MKLSEEIRRHARELPQQATALDYKKFLNRFEERIKKLHESGASGIEIVTTRACLIDTILSHAFEINQIIPTEVSNSFCLIATGGYGRRHLNPGSDVDLLFLLPDCSKKELKAYHESIQNMLYVLWDIGFKVGHASRTLDECIEEAEKEQQTKTALMDARLLRGDQALFSKFQKTFRKECVAKNLPHFLKLRHDDLYKRHKKYSETVFLQEPQVKESCGGLRDYHAILWISEVKFGTRKLDILHQKGIVTRKGIKEIQEAYEFLLRVRNEIHYQESKNNDILTLRLQGIVATNFNYPQESILRRCEAFMRDYYRHTRSLYHIVWSLMQTLVIEQREEKLSGWRNLLKSKQQKAATFDSCRSRNGLLYPHAPKLFEKAPLLLMRVFQHCQLRGLKFSPQMRKSIISNLKLINREFRYHKKTREAFRAMLERKGEVAQTLRQMHRVGFLGAYLPEFGALDCLVQHEFFHRYTADEHTLRTIDKLDDLLDDEAETKGNKAFFRRLFLDLEDPYAIYLALIMHDTGRALDLKEHTDGSAMLTSKVCTRLQIRAGRRTMITFLVDHHLTFWRYATTRNIDDPQVIGEFANIMQTPERLSALFLFTYADSNGTNDEAWSPWKEQLMMHLYTTTLNYLERGKENFIASVKDERQYLAEKTQKILDPKFHSALTEQLEYMPARYCRFREARSIASHVKSIMRFREKDAVAEHDRASAIRWITHEDRGYTEFTVTCWNQPLLLEKICCALAAAQINIISADVFTRTDDIVCDIFRVCTSTYEPITNKTTKSKVKATLEELMLADAYDPSQYLQKKKNYLTKDTVDESIPFPKRVFINNDLSEKLTAVEIQALDRIGLLHDLFLNIGKCGLATYGARICTEKGAAIDTIYVTTPEGGKVTDTQTLDQLQALLEQVIG